MGEDTKVAVRAIRREAMEKIKALKKEIDDLNAKLKNQGDMIIALQAGSEAAALGNVFIEAQKASDMLVGEAKSKAAQINYDAKKAADDTVAGANQIAEKIGISKPALYKHFESREEIVKALYSFLREKSKQNMVSSAVNLEELLQKKSLYLHYFLNNYYHQ